MITTEQAFDMLPHAIAIYEKLDLKKVGSQATERALKRDKEISKDKLQLAVAEQVFLHVVKESQKVKEDFFAMVAIAAGVPVSSAKSQGLGESVKILREIFMDPELWGFFKGAMQ